MRIIDWSSDVCSSDLGGYAPDYQERPLDSPEMAGMKSVVEHVLKGHEPYPALAVDRHWNMVAANAAVALLTQLAAPELFEPPVNVLRVALHPKGLAPHIVNRGEWRAHLLERLAPQIDASADEIGREPCRAGVCQYVSIWVAAGTLKKKKTDDTNKPIIRKNN